MSTRQAGTRPERTSLWQSRRRLGLPLRVGWALFAVIALMVSACQSGGSGGGENLTLKVVYQKDTASASIRDTIWGEIKTDYEAAHPGITVQLQPITADETNYYTQLTLRERSSAAPDIVYQDTFLVNQEIDAGNLAPIDQYTSTWADWSQFTDRAKAACQGQDGKNYGIVLGTDVRVLYYNKDILSKAGVQVPFAPKSWTDILSAARAVKANVPGVDPLHMVTGVSAGEGTSMQGFEMLLYGTNDKLWDPSNKKWVTESPGILDALNFYRTVYQTSHLGPDPSKAISAQYNSNYALADVPNGKLAMLVDGNWVASDYLASGAHPWPQASSVLGEALMPTENGQGSGYISLSGGWCYAITAKSQHKKEAFDLLTVAANKKYQTEYDLKDGAIPVRKDVAADSQFSSPDQQVFSQAVAYTQFRPAYSDYPKVSSHIPEMVEAVTVGAMSPQAAMKAFNSAVATDVGADKVESVSS